MKVVVHDYAGHPFQVQLSRNLANRGHSVLHLYSKSIQTPQGRLVRGKGDPEEFDVKGISLSRPLKKYGLFSRRLQDIEHGKRVVEELRRFKPDVVLSGNTWLDAQGILLKECKKNGIRFVYWVQDLFGIGIKRVLSRRLPVFGHLVGWYYVRKERYLLRKSDAIVGITEDFNHIFDSYQIPKEKVVTIENWAPIDDVPVLPKDNKWAREHACNNKFCFLYSGTMGMKHNPDLILRLSLEFKREDNVVIVVVSEGLGAEYLKEKKEEFGLNNLIVVGFQPFDVLPMVLASADVLVAVLEPDAGVFSVPSKVLTYMCAGRAILLGVPPENLASRIVERNQAGLTVNPGDEEGFVALARRLYEDGDLRRSCAIHARQYAERTFDIEQITDKFEGVLFPEKSKSTFGGVTREAMVS